MKKSFAILSLVLAPWIEAFAGIEFDGNMLTNVILPAQPSPRRAGMPLPFYSFGLRYCWPSRAALGIRYITPLGLEGPSGRRDRRFHLSASTSAMQVVGLQVPPHPAIDAAFGGRIVGLPVTSLIELTFPLLSLGIFHASASLGLGGANWGALPLVYGDARVGEMPRLRGEIKMDKWDLAYSALINLQCRLGRFKLYISYGYMSLGTLTWFRSASLLDICSASLLNVCPASMLDIRTESLLGIPLAPSLAIDTVHVRGPAVSVGLGFGF